MAVDYRDDPILCGLLRYWERKRNGRPMPRRADIEPTEIPRLLPYLSITQVIDGGARLRYRLVGTAVVEAYGIDYTGHYVDELLSGERRAFVERLCHTVIRERRPLFARSEYGTPPRYPADQLPGIVAHRVMAPLSEDGAAVHMIVTAFTFKYGGQLPEAIDLRSPTGIAARAARVLTPEELAALAESGIVED